MLMIVGLGNPGKEYSLTRHNIGFEAIDYLARTKGINISKNEKEALTGFYFENGKKILLVKPLTYMNNSGVCVRALVEYYDIDIKDLLVIYDDIDLSVGKIRIRQKGSAGTHNGMRSIIYHLRKDDFPRVRIGIGSKPPGWDLANYVLSKFKEEDIEPMQLSVKNATSAVNFFVNDGIDVAMNRLNVRDKSPNKKETAKVSEEAENSKTANN